MLIILIAIHPAPSPQSIPLANAFLASYAAHLPLEIRLFDVFLDDDLHETAQIISSLQPTSIGFSSYVWNRNASHELAAILRQLLPQSTLFAGGPEVTASHRSFLETGLYDFIIRGEGELPFLHYCQSLLDGRDCAEIPGVITSPSSTPTQTAMLENLDELPSPYLNSIIDTSTTPGLLWQLSRGCCFGCTFCYDARGVGGVRHFSLQRIEEELRLFVAHNVSQVFVLDSTFNMDKKRAKAILAMIRTLAPHIHFHFEVRSEFLDQEMALLFSEITCSLQIGLQSAHQDVLQTVGRSFNKRDFTTKISLLNESGAIFGFDLIYGLPNDTYTNFCSSLDYALSLYPNHLDIFPLAVLPGTILAEQASDMGLHWHPEPPYTLIDSVSFPADQMKSASALATACDIFYTRGKAVAWFNAVCTVLKRKPSAFLSLFSDWLFDNNNRLVSEKDFTDQEILAMQLSFLHEVCTRYRCSQYINIINDLVNYHYLYAAVLLGHSPDGEPAHSNAASNASYRLAETAYLAFFTYDIEQLLECGEPRIDWMYDNFLPTETSALIYRNPDILCTEVIAPQYARLLQHITQTDSPIDYPAIGLSTSEADEFIDFAVTEGIIIPACG